MAITRYVGIKEEATYGTEASDSTYDFDMGSVGLDSPDDPNIALPTLQRFQTRHIPGFYSPGGPMEYPIDIHTIGWFLKWALGGYEFTEGTSPAKNVHEFWATPEYELPSFTTRVGKDNFEHVFIGCIINKLNLSIENELAMAKLDVVAQQDTKDALRETLNTLDPTLFPMAFYNVATTIDAVDVSADVKTWSWDFSNGVKPEDGQGQGSRFPYHMKPGAGECTLGVKWEGDIEDIEDKIEEYWANAAGPGTDHHTSFITQSVFSSGTKGQMTVKFPACYYKRVPTDLKGADPLAPDLSIGTEAAEVTLADGLTKVTTPVYVKLENLVDELVLGT